MFRLTKLIIKDPAYIRNLMDMTNQQIYDLSVESSDLLCKLNDLDNDEYEVISQKLDKIQFTVKYLQSCWNYYKSEYDKNKESL